MRVLLATDGSSHSRRATRWLRDLALPSETTVAVLAVATLDDPPRDSQTMSELREAVHRRARRAVERAARTLRKRWPEVDMVVRDGDPRVELVRVADEMAVGLVVLGARGLGRVKRFLIGSTSLAAARYAPCPVAIVRGRPHKTRRVLVAIDGSNGSRGALRFLSVSELEPDSRVTLLHVVPGAAVDRSRDAAADELLRDAATTLEQSKRRTERLVAHGDPAREIVKIAQRRDVDIVLVGARGLGTLGRFLLGSVSETVLHQARRPVIIVRE